MHSCIQYINARASEAHPLTDELLHRPAGDASIPSDEATVRIVCPVHRRCEHAHGRVCNITTHGIEAQLPAIGGVLPVVIAADDEATECLTNHSMHP